MEFRKLIKFGNSSYVVSLPKKWIIENKLEKGAVIYIEEDKDGNLTFAPKEPPESEPRTYVLDITGMDEAILKRQICSAYINNYQYFEIRSKKPIKDPMDLKNILTYFVGLEIMEESHTRILVRNFVDVKMVSIEELMKKMFLLLKSMMKDLTELNLDTLNSREKEIDKLHFLVRKLILYNLDNPSLMKLHKKTTSDFLILRGITFTTEEMGDEIKYVASIFEKMDKKSIAPDYIELMQEIAEFHEQVMDIFFENDIKTAISISGRKNEIRKKIHKTFEVVKLPLGSDTQSFEAGLIMGHLLKMISQIHHTLRTVYTYHLEE